MEPQNEGLENDFPFQRAVFSGFMLIIGGVKAPENRLKLHPFAPKRKESPLNEESPCSGWVLFL